MICRDANEYKQHGHILTWEDYCKLMARVDAEVAQLPPADQKALLNKYSSLVSDRPDVASLYWLRKPGSYEYILQWLYDDDRGGEHGTWVLDTNNWMFKDENYLYNLTPEMYKALRQMPMAGRLEFKAKPAKK